MQPAFVVLRLGKPEGEGNADGGMVQGMGGEAAR